MQSEIVGTPHRHHTGSIRYPLKSAGTTISVGSLYDLSTVLTWNLDEFDNARMHCKHIRRSPGSPTMSKKS